MTGDTIYSNEFKQLYNVGPRRHGHCRLMLSRSRSGEARHPGMVYIYTYVTSTPSNDILQMGTGLFFHVGGVGVTRLNPAHCPTEGWYTTYQPSMEQYSVNIYIVKIWGHEVSAPSHSPPLKRWRNIRKFLQAPIKYI